MPKVRPQPFSSLRSISVNVWELVGDSVKEANATTPFYMCDLGAIMKPATHTLIYYLVWFARKIENIKKGAERFAVSGSTLI